MGPIGRIDHATQPSPRNLGFVRRCSRVFPCACPFPLRRISATALNGSALARAGKLGALPEHAGLQDLLPRIGRMAIVTLALFGAHSAPNAAEKAAVDPVFAEMAGRIAPSMTLIAGYMGQKEEEPYGEASGFFVRESGLVVSVLDVFTDRKTRRMCDFYRLRLSDGRQLEAQIFSADAVLNLVLLQTKAPGPFPAISIERRVSARSGEPVVAIAGNRPDEAVSYSTGYVKAKHKQSVYGTGFGDMLINTQIRLPDHGWGGPLLNAHGELIGVNTTNIYAAKPETANAEEAHALPVGLIQNFFKVSQVYPTSEQNWIGLDVRPLTPEERDWVYKTLGQRAGLYIDFVWDEGPASQSGVRAGDILFKLDGTALKDTYQLNQLLLAARPGKTTELFVLRKDHGFVSRIGLDKRPAWAGFVR